MYEKIVDEIGSSVKNVVVVGKVGVNTPSDDVDELEIGVNGIVIFGDFVVVMETLLLSVNSVVLLISVTVKIGFVVIVLNVVVSSEDIVVLVIFRSASAVNSSVDLPVQSIAVVVEYGEVSVIPKLEERSVLVPYVDVLVNGNLLLLNGKLVSVISLEKEENVLLNSIELKVEDDSSIVEISIVIFGTYISVVVLDENGYFVVSGLVDIASLDKGINDELGGNDDSDMNVVVLSLASRVELSGDSVLS